jgi:hypothetical protein
MEHNFFRKLLRWYALLPVTYIYHKSIVAHLSVLIYSIWQWHVTRQKHTDFILVFPWQQWLSKRATMLRNTCNAYLARLPLFCTNITHVTQTCDFRKSTTYSNKSLGNLLNIYQNIRRHNPKSINRQLYILLTQAHIYSFFVFHARSKGS